MERSSQLQEIRARQEKWLRERQAEMDRERVVSELRADSMGGPGSAGTHPSQQRSSSYPAAGPPSSSGYAPPASSSGGGYGSPGLSGGPGGGGGYGAGSGFSGGPGALRQQQAHTSSSSSPSYSSGSQQQQQQQQQQLGWSGTIRPEAVIDKLTERIADRLRSELKMELQKESETLQQKVVHENLEMDDFLAKELETQNTCPICYDLMVPPAHAPQLLFPCGHTFCCSCISTHLDQQRKQHCPICRKKVESRAPNYSLQQLILNFVAKKHRMQSPAVAAVAQSMEAGRGALGGVVPFDDESMSELDRLRRQSSRIQIRLTVLENELTDTITEHQSLDGKCMSARMVLDHMRAEEQGVLQRMAALQAELDLLRSQMGSQQLKLDQAADEAQAVLSRRQMLVDTIEPLRAELHKVEILKQGLLEQERRNTRG